MVKRVSIVGNSGSGKSTFGRKIAAVIDAPYVELDEIHHLADWVAINPDKFVSIIQQISAGPSWVIDGNYRLVVVDGPVWKLADTVIWIDLPRLVVMRQIVRRSIQRVWRGEVLWNGNREYLRNLFAWNPNKSVIRWSWTQHAKYVDRYSQAMCSEQYAHITFIRLRSHQEAQLLVRNLKLPW